jgi:hypothetical protein
MSASKMISHFQATDFGVIQTIFQIGDDWFLRDYEGTLYNFEDVTDDGLVFHPVKGWTQKFFLKQDLEVLRSMTLEMKERKSDEDKTDTG